MAEQETDQGRRNRLAQVKIRALARAAVGERPWVVATTLAGGAALHDGEVGVVLLSGHDDRGLGGALAWAAKAGVDGALHVLVEGGGAGIVARRARYFRRPPLVWQVEGATVALAEPLPFPPVIEPAGADLEAIEALRRAGADVVVEHGVVAGEILGLEVGRVVEGRLEVGVGKHDRAASAVMEAVTDRSDVLASVVAAVRRHRRPDASPHLLNRLARERWLRSLLVADPSLVGAGQLDVAEPPVPRRNLVERVAAIALGRTSQGAALIVACSVGVDLEVVPFAADARARLSPDAELVIVTPARDQYPALVALAASLAEPARLVAIEGAWPGGSPHEA